MNDRSRYPVHLRYEQTEQAVCGAKEPAVMTDEARLVDCDRCLRNEVYQAAKAER